MPAGDYKMDPAHSTLIFRVNHMGFSKYTARFRRFDAQLRFDPRNLTATQLTATVDPRSIETDFPDPKYNFNAELAGEQWLDAAKFPEIAFRTTRVEDLGNQAMRVHAELTMHGVTRPIVLDATYNGGYVGHPMDPHARVGFSAHGRAAPIRIRHLRRHSAGRRQHGRRRPGRCRHRVGIQRPADGQGRGRQRRGRENRSETKKARSLSNRTVTERL